MSEAEKGPFDHPELDRKANPGIFVPPTADQVKAGFRFDAIKAALVERNRRSMWIPENLGAASLQLVSDNEALDASVDEE